MVQESRAKLVISSELAEICKTQRTVLGQVSAAGYNKNATFAIKLALDEALNNAVRHGNSGNPDKQVIVEYSIDDSAVQIVITDEGGGFSPRKVRNPTLDENLDRPHGRGIMLMKAYMTDVRYNKRGNRVTLVKRRDCSLPKLD